MKSTFQFLGLLYFSTALLLTTKTFSQSIPPFKMVLSDNKIFTANDLPKGTPVILIYFDPDCDHCQKLMTAIFKKINDFKKAEIVMVTFKTTGDVAAFDMIYLRGKFSFIFNYLKPVF